MKRLLKILVIGLTYKEGALDYTNALGFTFAKEAARRGFDVSAYDREGTSAETLMKHGIKKVNPNDVFTNQDTIIVGFPGYPQEIVETGKKNGNMSVVIDPWK